MNNNNLIRIVLRILVITTIIFLIITLILSYFVSINIGFNINTDNDWIGYYGTYLGSIVTAVVSVVGIYITLEYYREKDNEELNILKDELIILKEQVSLAVMPYFSIKSIDKSQVVDINFKITNNSSIQNFSNGKRIVLKNVGNGSAIDCEFDLQENTQFNKKITPFGCAKEDVINLMFDVAQNSFKLDDKLYILLKYKDLKSKCYNQKIWLKKKSLTNDYMDVTIDPPVVVDCKK